MRIVKHDMTQELVIRLLGWKWMSFVGIPTKGTAGYPSECRVRQLLSAEQLKLPRWKKFLMENEGAEATGDEPLSYSYCSSGGSDAMLPTFTILVDD